MTNLSYLLAGEAVVPIVIVIVLILFMLILAMQKNCFIWLNYLLLILDFES